MPMRQATPIELERETSVLGLKMFVPRTVGARPKPPVTANWLKGAKCGFSIELATHHAQPRARRPDVGVVALGELETAPHETPRGAGEATAAAFGATEPGAVAPGTPAGAVLDPAPASGPAALGLAPASGAVAPASADVTRGAGAAGAPEAMATQSCSASRPQAIVEIQALTPNRMSAAG